MKVALVYDRVNKIGGAERILQALHDLFPDAPLYTAVYNKETAPWAGVFTVKTSFLQYIPFAKTHHEFFAPLMPLAFESFSFDEYDLVISVSSEAAKGIITGQKTKHISYVLTPTRYLWSGYEEYFKNIFFKTLTLPVVRYLRFWDQIAAQRADKMISISQEVKRRVKRYYLRESILIYPPVEISNFSRHSGIPHLRGQFPISNKYKKTKIPKESDYFLVVSRLVPYKRIDIAIEACNELKLPLKIVGSGSESSKLREIAGPTVELVGTLTDQELVEYYKNCKALLFPGDEDFGLTVVEAQFFGKPVIAYKKGGALETIVEGKTGEFFFPQTKGALIKKLKDFNEKKYKNTDCKSQARKFDIEQFKNKFLAALRKES